MTVIERFVASSVGALTLVDRFVLLRGTRGLFPPPLGGVRFKLTARVINGVTAPLVPPFEPAVLANATGVYRFPGDGKVGGTAMRRIPDGRYRLLVESDFYQPLEQDLDWPPDPKGAPLELRAGYPYPFPDLTMERRLTLVRGTLIQPGTGLPIPGAVVTLASPPPDLVFEPGLSDASGAWAMILIWGRADGPLNLTVRFETATGNIEVPGVAIAPGADNSLPQTALRGGVFTSTGGPIPRAIVTVAGHPGQALAAADGSWSYYFDLLQPDAAALVTATAPNGRSQMQSVQIRNRATVIVPPFGIVMN